MWWAKFALQFVQTFNKRMPTVIPLVTTVLEFYKVVQSSCHG